MPKRVIALLVGVAAVVASLTRMVGGQILPWNNPGMAQGQNQLQTGPPASAPKRDLAGIWDAGGAGIGARGAAPAPLTPWGEALGKTHKAGDGIRQSPIEEINDPLSTMGDPEGFPRNLLFELRPFQIVHTPNQVLMLYMFEKRWRVIWTDGRQLPKDPDPRWYGYSVGRWEDDSTFVVDSNGTDERTWLDNAGNPHSTEMKVEERYHRVNANTLELTVTIDDPKAYTKPWVARNKLPLRLMPPNTDLMEMIPSATEAAAYKKVFAAPGK
jgi:hypothetical protein